MMIDTFASVASSSPILVASTGGHLQQMLAFARKAQLMDVAHWITFDHPQSRAQLLDVGLSVTFVPYICPRDLKGVAAACPTIWREIDARSADAVVSTGAAIAVPALTVAAVKGMRAVYVESISRTDGPSLTGMIVSRIPGIETYTQHRAWATERWRPIRSVFGSYIAEKTNDTKPTIHKAFVTVGTIKPYRFDAMLRAVSAVVSDGVALTWQVGETTCSGLRGNVRDYLSQDEFDRYVLDADVVITHAGVGSVMRILELGRMPIIVPRRAGRNEHVDDHQMQIARSLHSAGVAIMAEPNELTVESLEFAAARRVFSNDR